MGGAVVGEELDTEVFYRKGESGGLGCVGPKTGGVRHRSVSVGLEVEYKTLVGDDDGFF